MAWSEKRYVDYGGGKLFWSFTISVADLVGVSETSCDGQA